MSKCRIITNDMDIEITATRKRRELFIDWVRTNRDLTPQEQDIIDTTLNDIANAMEQKDARSNARE